jgi:hypothetical protein
MLVCDDGADDNVYRLLCQIKHNNMEAYKERGSSTIMKNNNNNNSSIPSSECLAVASSL